MTITLIVERGGGNREERSTLWNTREYCRMIVSTIEKLISKEELIRKRPTKC